MSLSFRTNGNFIDFVNTDATSLNVETVIMKLHNTSRCIDWSLPVDTSKISFTIDGVKYSNISITEIDFDGTVMNSQDDFETGITAMFEGLAGGGGSGGGVESVTAGDASIIIGGTGTNPTVKLPYKVYTAWMSQEVDTINSGTPLVVGQQYKIAQYTGGDDFTNVGAPSNATNILFIASGTTPTTWTSSTLHTAGDLIIDVFGPNTIGDISWVKSGVGYYVGTLAGAFPQNRTVCPPFDFNAYGYLPLQGQNNIFEFGWINGWNAGNPGNELDLVVAYANYDPVDISMVSSNLKLLVEVRVYP